MRGKIILFISKTEKTSVSVVFFGDRWALDAVPRGFWALDAVPHDFWALDAVTHDFWALDAAPHDLIRLPVRFPLIWINSFPPPLLPARH